MPLDLHFSTFIAVVVENNNANRAFCRLLTVFK